MARAYTHYNQDSHPADTGCQLAPSCLSCPLPECYYDNPTAYLHLVRKNIPSNAKEDEVMMLLGGGLTRQEVATLTALNIRTVYRIQARTQLRG